MTAPDFGSWQSIILSHVSRSREGCSTAYSHTSLHDDQMTFYLLSDGLWDVLSNEAAVAAMRNVFSNSSKSAADVAGDMLDIALRRGTVN